MQTHNQQENCKEMPEEVYSMDEAEIARLNEDRIKSEKAASDKLERRLHRIEMRLGLVGS